jgi:hypothetical protein
MQHGETAKAANKWTGSSAVNALSMAMPQCRVQSADDAVLTQFPNSKDVMYLAPQVSLEYQYVLKAVMLLYLHTVYVDLDFAPLKLRLP